MVSPGTNPIRRPAQWLTSYRALTETLEQIRTQELAALTDQEALRQINSLSTPDSPWRERPNWSGLVEQQALFHRRKKP